MSDADRTAVAATNEARLRELATMRYGAARAGEIVALAAGLIAGLEIVARAQLSGVDEPDFLGGDGAL